MSSRYKVRIREEEFSVSRWFLFDPETDIEFSTWGESPNGLFAEFWASGPKRDELRDWLSIAPTVERVTKERRTAHRTRYSVRWASGATPELRRLDEFFDRYDVQFHRGRASAFAWEFFVTFPTQSAIVEFYSTCSFENTILRRLTEMETESVVSPSSENTVSAPKKMRID